jgi:hypothetical protein
MRRGMWWLCLTPLALAGCYHDDSDDRWGEGDCSGDASYQTGLSFDLSAVQRQLEASAPVTIKACFDVDCDVLDLVVDRQGSRCEGAPGGPPDQLTGCVFSRAGDLRVNILRIDGRDYGDGRPHTAAISITDQRGERLLSHAEQVSYSGHETQLITITPR